MKILFLPNWTVNHSDTDMKNLQEPDKYIKGKKYWFFNYFPQDTTVDIIDIRKNNKLHFIEKKIKFYIWQAILAYKADKAYDVVISHGAQSGVFYSLLRTLSRKNTPLHIIIDIGGMNGGRKNKLENGFLNFALKSNPHIICHSKIIIQNYKETYRNLLPLTHYIPFGINAKEFSPIEKKESGNFVFSFGYAKRDYDTLFKAWESVRKDTIRLLVAGIDHYPQRHDNSVEFLGQIDVMQLKDYIQRSKFVVIPLPVFNYSYGQMSFLQSMCLGKTVIVTRTPSSIDYIKDGEGAFFVEPYNIEDMKDKIEYLLREESILQENNLKARNYVLENYTEEKMGQRIYDYIRSIGMNFFTNRLNRKREA